MAKAGSFDVCLLTPPGRGAVATIAVSGAGAAGAIGQFFRASSGTTADELIERRIYHGRWGHGEEIVACRTADEDFQLHCHGGVSAPQRLVDDLVGLGGRIVEWREWLARLPGGRLAYDAQVALCHAPTERTANILLDQLQGALADELRAAGDECCQHDLVAAGARLRALIRYAPLGLHLIEPYQVVLAGRPNVGKSSLINALVGYQRAIVCETPGTTRDIVTAETAIDGWPVQLSDTAGLRASLDPLEEAGMRRASQRLTDCDLVVLVFDASQPESSDDKMLRNEFRSAVVVRNKCDLPPEPPVLRNSEEVVAVATSALTGAGIGDLLRAISQRLVADPPPVGAAVPFTSGQVQGISAALASVEQNDVQRAAAILQALLA